VEKERFLSFWRFYFQPLLTAPLLFLPLAWRDRRILLLTLTGLLVLAGNNLYGSFSRTTWRPCAVCLFADRRGNAAARGSEDWGVARGNLDRPFVDSDFSFKRFSHHRWWAYGALVGHGRGHSQGARSISSLIPESTWFSFATVPPFFP
jgi:hypothetical protein